MLNWFLPSTFGDIRLTQKDKLTTEVVIFGLSPQEKIAVNVLLKRAKTGTLVSAPWATTEMLNSLDLDSLKEQSITLAAPISDVAKVLSKPLKPMRKQVSVVRFTSGRIEELTEQTIGLIDATEPKAKAKTEPEKKLPAPPADKPKVAATVAQPTIGCPLPDFDPADIRANRVLAAFLTPVQLADFNERRQFVVVGADTGHRYMLTSRHAPDLLRHVGNRQVYDLDEDMPLCVHDWEVPAAEELLGLALHLQLSGQEHFVRSIPDREGILHG